MVYIFSLLNDQTNMIKGWQKWEFWRGTEQKKQQVKDIMTKWRSYLPPWSIFSHSAYPVEFEKLAVQCLCFWNQLERMWKMKIPKDIKRHLIKYIADVWRKKVDES